MPNHCEGQLTVVCKKGDEEDLIAFKLLNLEGGKPTLNASAFIPYPTEYVELDKKAEEWDATPKEKRRGERPKSGFGSGGYDWCIKNWGTKWGFYDVELVDDLPTRLQYAFMTAWSPATPVVKTMSAKFPKLRFNYKFWEGGAGYSGQFKAKAGKILIDSTVPYDGPRGG